MLSSHAHAYFIWGVAMKEEKKAKALLGRASVIALLISVLIGISFNNHTKESLNRIIQLGEEERGPESLAFDGDGRGPYASISDGRILKWQFNQTNWLPFAASSSLREKCEGRGGDEREPICGRPLGVCFNESNGDLYIADAYLGLLLVGPTGGPATPVATAAEGLPFMFTNGLDIDHLSGVVFFTDSSSRFQRRNYIYILLSGDMTGRLMKYDPKSKQVTTLMRDLAFPNGVALSEDGSFILVAETSKCRILKYWIRTSKVEVFAELPGFPDNIKRSPRGGYWVGINSRKDQLAKWILAYPWVGNALIKLPFNLMRFYSILSTYRGSGMGVRLDENGKVLEVFEDASKFTSISEVMEKDGVLWIGSINLPFVGAYNLTT